MTGADVTAKLEAELLRGAVIDSLHGITQATVRGFLVQPYELVVDPDDLETTARKMWVVLHERPSVPEEGYLVAYDPTTAGWSVVERRGASVFVQVVSAHTLLEALEAM